MSYACSLTISCASCFFSVDSKTGPKIIVHFSGACLCVSLLLNRIGKVPGLMAFGTSRTLERRVHLASFMSLKANICMSY